MGWNVKWVSFQAFSFSERNGLTFEEWKRLKNQGSKKAFNTTFDVNNCKWVWGFAWKMKVILI